MVKDREIQAHKEWLGFLQPVGLVVSPTALNNAQMSVNRNVVELQQRLSEIVRRDSSDDSTNYTCVISDFPAFTVEILGWQPTDLVESPEDLEVSLPEYGETLQPTYAVPDPDNGGWLMLVQVISLSSDFDRVREDIKSTGWHATVKFNRDEIQSLGDENYDAKRDFYQATEELLHDARLKGDLVIASFFAAEKDKARKEERDGLFQKYFKWRRNPDESAEVLSISRQLRQADKPVKPFNWEIEFLEVFDRENPGFDAIVGNPPFLGGSRISSNFSVEYLEWLKVINPEAHGNSDLVAHFYRRAFTLLRKSGCFGLIATNTIAQGDTRTTGLKYICENIGTIYNAQKRLKWPGLAAVVVSVVNIFKGNYQGIKLLDKRKVDFISAFLFHSGGHKNPVELMGNSGKSFLGSKIYGQGFAFDDSDTEATSIVEMYQLINKNPKNQERIFPYIGGEEVNSSPTHAHHRYVINFGEMSEAEAREYPDLMKIVEEKVKPARLAQKREIRARYWWRFGETTPALYKAIAPLNQVLVCSLVSQYLSFAFLPANIVFSHALNIFTDQRNSFFCIIQSQIHEIWGRFFASSLEDRLRYNPSDCFETFPFPENWETNSTLEAIGKEYYEYRAALMVRNNQGLTDTYNRFHNPDEYDPEILKLRELHTAMDKAVLDAYGWSDIPTDCDFILDYEEEEDTENSSGRQKKKPWRYRWREEIHDEVLARLLDLNQKCKEAEILGGKAADKSKVKRDKVIKGRKNTKNKNDMVAIPGMDNVRV